MTERDGVGGIIRDPSDIFNVWENGVKEAAHDDG